MLDSTWANRLRRPVNCLSRVEFNWTEILKEKKIIIRNSSVSRLRESILFEKVGYLFKVNVFFFWIVNDKVNSTFLAVNHGVCFLMIFDDFNDEFLILKWLLLWFWISLWNWCDTNKLLGTKRFSMNFYEFLWISMSQSGRGAKTIRFQEVLSGKRVWMIFS